jgi:hypothetical protein
VLYQTFEPFEILAYLTPRILSEEPTDYLAQSASSTRFILERNFELGCPPTIERQETHRS